MSDFDMYVAQAGTFPILCENQSRIFTEQQCRVLSNQLELQLGS